MTATDFQDFLRDVLLCEAADEIRRVSTFEEAGVLTTDAGLVVSIGDAQFQMTVVQSA